MYAPFFPRFAFEQVTAGAYQYIYMIGSWLQLLSRNLIGSLRCFLLLGLLGEITLVFLVFRQLFGNGSKNFQQS